MEYVQIAILTVAALCSLGSLACSVRVIQLRRRINRQRKLNSTA